MGDPHYKESDVKYIHAIATHPDPVVTAVEIAEKVGVSQQATHSKLSDLYERRLVKRKEVGARSVVWWLTTDGLDVYREVAD